MQKYSISLNFIIPPAIVKKLKRVKVVGKVAFDWRQSRLCHCTINELFSGNRVPQAVQQWAEKAALILDKQKAFKVKIKNIDRFSKVIYAGVQSRALVNLHKKLFKVLPSANLKFENENYIPHVTLVVCDGDFEILSNKKQEFGEFEVQEVQLKISEVKERERAVICKKWCLKV